MLEENEELEQPFYISGTGPGSSIALGSLTVHAARDGSNGDPIPFTFPLPVLPVVEEPLRVTLVSSTVARFGEPMPVKFTLCNNTNKMQVNPPVATSAPAVQCMHAVSIQRYGRGDLCGVIPL